jgi:hypothetical protein
MSKREVEVERDADGRIIGYEEHVERPRRKSGGGFGWGMLFGVIVLAVGIVAFAYNQGGFQEAGLEADQATAQAEETVGATAEAAGDQIEAVTDDIASNTNDADASATN